MELAFCCFVHIAYTCALYASYHVPCFVTEPLFHLHPSCIFTVWCTYVAYNAIIAQVCCGQLTGDLSQPEEQRIYRDMNPCNPEIKLLYVTPEKVFIWTLVRDGCSACVVAHSEVDTFIQTEIQMLAQANLPAPFMCSPLISVVHLS